MGNMYGGRAAGEGVWDAELRNAEVEEDSGLVVEVGEGREKVGFEGGVICVGCGGGGEGLRRPFVADPEPIFDVADCTCLVAGEILVADVEDAAD